MGKAKAFEKHMKISLNDFYDEFDRFIKKSDDEVMKFFEKIGTYSLSFRRLGRFSIWFISGNCSLEALSNDSNFRAVTMSRLSTEFMALL